MGGSRSILQIGNPDDEDSPKEDFLSNYGNLTLEQVVASEMVHINNEERAAQDTYMLYKCLMASLSAEAKKKVLIWSYMIGHNHKGSGVALLKVIIRESHIDTNATTNQIRTKLSNLDIYMSTINSDIGKFNTYVKLLVQSLTARNQTTSDLLINLFKGYGAVSDEVFRAWLTRKQDDHEEGTPITPDELMLAAKNKFDSMVEKGMWNAPTAEEKSLRWRPVSTRPSKHSKRTQMRVRKVHTSAMRVISKIRKTNHSLSIPNCGIAQNLEIALNESTKNVLGTGVVNSQEVNVKNDVHTTPRS